MAETRANKMNELQKKIKAERAFSQKIRASKKVDVTLSGENWSITLGRQDAKEMIKKIALEHDTVADVCEARLNRLNNKE